MIEKKKFADIVDECWKSGATIPDADVPVQMTRGGLAAMHALILRASEQQADEIAGRVMKMLPPALFECVKLAIDAEVKKRRMLSWRGPFDPGLSYKAGDLVQMRAQLFVAQKDAPTGVPGSAVDWRMLLQD